MEDSVKGGTVALAALLLACSSTGKVTRPTAALSLPSCAVVGKAFMLDASKSTGDIILYAFTVGRSNPAVVSDAPTLNYTFEQIEGSEEQVAVLLEVIDASGSSARTQKSIVVTTDDAACDEQNVYEIVAPASDVHEEDQTQPEDNVTADVAGDSHAVDVSIEVATDLRLPHDVPVQPDVAEPDVAPPDCPDISGNYKLEVVCGGKPEMTLVNVNVLQDGCQLSTDDAKPIVEGTVDADGTIHLSTSLAALKMDDCVGKQDSNIKFHVDCANGCTGSFSMM
jgi:hypothetical protein